MHSPVEWALLSSSCLSKVSVDAGIGGESTLERLFYFLKNRENVRFFLFKLMAFVSWNGASLPMAFNCGIPTSYLHIPA